LKVNILENVLPESKKAAQDGVSILDIGCGYGGLFSLPQPDFETKPGVLHPDSNEGIARMLKIRYPHARVIGVEFQPLVRDLAKKVNLSPTRGRDYSTAVTLK